MRAASSDAGTQGDSESSSSSGGSSGSTGSSSSGGGSTSSSSGAGSGGSSGSSSSSGGSSGGSSGSSSGSGSGCPATPPSGSCSQDGQVCHYPGGQGETDCGCASGSWQCYSGCGLGSQNYPVNPSLCQPQLQSTSTCNPYSGICGYSIEIPCWGDGGVPLSEVDAGPGQCAAWCAAAAPPGAPTSTACDLGVRLVDGGADAGEVLVAQCAACGI